MQHARALGVIKVTFSQLPGHLHADIEHSLGYLDVLALQKCLGISGKVQHHQAFFVFCATQCNAPIRQLDDL
ncbi:hypothetical protein D9M68_916210 [compost metagenome]